MTTNTQEMSNKELAEVMIKMTESGIFKNDVAPFQQAVFIEAIDRLNKTTIADQFRPIEIDNFHEGEQGIEYTDISDAARSAMAGALKTFSECLFDGCQVRKGGAIVKEPEPGVFELTSNLVIRVV